MRGLRRLYHPALDWALRHRSLVLVGAAVVLMNGVFLSTRLGSEFVPKLQEGTIVINTVRLAGISLEESARYGTRIEKVLLAKFPNEIEHIWTRTGTPEVATDPMGLEVSDVFATLKPVSGWKQATTQEGLVEQMQRELETLPGMRAAFMQPIELRMNEMVAGIRSDVGVKLFGDDLEILKAKAREIETLLKKIPGAVDVSVEQVTGQPGLQVEVNRTAISRHGIPVSEVLSVVDALGTREVGVLQEGERRFPITVRIADTYRLDPEAIGRIPVTAANGDRIPLSQLAKLSVVEGPNAVNREWAKRRLVVQANVRGRDLGGFVKQAQAAIERDLALPPSYFVRFGGQFEQLERAQARLLVVVPIALILIFVLLYFSYGRVADALRVFTGVPFAAVGGVAALWLRDLPFSISAGVGFVALSGVSVLGDMVLVSTVQQLRAKGVPMPEAVRSAAQRRLRPVLMTSLVASLGFVPMALNTGVGAEVQRPLATVVIGGVISSTLLTLIVLPVLYLIFTRKTAGSSAQQSAAPQPTPGADAAQAAG